jgi:hypothetical protein
MESFDVERLGLSSSGIVTLRGWDSNPGYRKFVVHQTTECLSCFAKIISIVIKVENTTNIVII